MDSEILQCSDCGSEEVTHVLVDYHHDIIEPAEYFCRNHAFADGRSMCSCCENFSGSEVTVENGDKMVELKRTYPNEELDADGMCSDHP
jgi:hypothetical protein